MDYILEPNLERIALVKISSLLWNQYKIRELIGECPIEPGVNQEWKKIEQKVKKNAEKLGPGQFKEKVLGYIRPMGYQILDWIEYHCLTRISRICYLSVPIPAEFSWTPYGTINKRETAKLFIQDRTIDSVTRYKMAFIYCLEVDTQIIWDSIPEDCDSPVTKTKYNAGVITERDLVTFWTNLNEPLTRLQKLAPHYNNAFLNAIIHSNKVAADYLWRKLYKREKEIYLIVARELPDVDVLWFLLSKMDEKQKVKVFQEKPVSMLRKFFTWPRLSVYLETAHLFWKHLSAFEDEYGISPLTVLIGTKITSRFEDPIYRELFKELWKSACRRFGPNRCASECLLNRLFDVKDREHLEMIFRVTSPVIKKRFILSRTGFGISIQLTKENDQELLDFFMRQCLSSEDEIEEYKIRLEPYISPSCKRKRKRIFCFVLP